MLACLCTKILSTRCNDLLLTFEKAQEAPAWRAPGHSILCRRSKQESSAAKHSDSTIEKALTPCQVGSLGSSVEMPQLCFQYSNHALTLYSMVSRCFSDFHEPKSRHTESGHAFIFRNLRTSAEIAHSSSSKGLLKPRFSFSTMYYPFSSSTKSKGASECNRLIRV